MVCCKLVWLRGMCYRARLLPITSFRMQHCVKWQGWCRRTRLSSRKWKALVRAVAAWSPISAVIALCLFTGLERFNKYGLRFFSAIEVGTCACLRVSFLVNDEHQAVWLLVRISPPNRLANAHTCVSCAELLEVDRCRAPAMACPWHRGGGGGGGQRVRIRSQEGEGSPEEEERCGAALYLWRVCPASVVHAITPRW